MKHFSLVVVLAIVAVFPALAALSAAEKQALPAKDSKDELIRLQKERVQVLTQAVEYAKFQVDSGRVGAMALWKAEMELINAEVDLAATPEARIAMLEKLQAKAEQISGWAEKGMKYYGTVPPPEVFRAKVAVLDVKIRIVRERAKLAPPAK